MLVDIISISMVFCNIQTDVADSHNITDNYTKGSKAFVTFNWIDIKKRS